LDYLSGNKLLNRKQSNGFGISNIPKDLPEFLPQRFNTSKGSSRKKWNFFFVLKIHL